MTDPIYLIPDDSSANAIKLEPKAYSSEQEFQLLLRRFPELLAGEQVDRANPRRWLLIAREMSVPDEAAGTARWSLDHFFVDQDGMPTLVEVKRQSDTRIRREVVGQMLDYAANAARFWPAAFMAAEFERTCKESSLDPAVVLREFLGTPDLQPSAFWASVEARLRDGEMRLIFFADDIPKELRRIVEFLNSQMTRTEVLAVEVRRYSGQGYSTHIPTLIGDTAEADATKVSSRAGLRRKWDEGQFLAACSGLPEDTQIALKRLIQLTAEGGFIGKWGTGQITGSLNVVIDGVCPRSVMSFFSDGKLMLNFGWLPQSLHTSLAAFARTRLDIVLEDGWQQEWVPVHREVWTPRVDSVLEFLRSARKSNVDVPASIP